MMVDVRSYVRLRLFPFLMVSMFISRHRPMPYLVPYDRDDEHIYLGIIICLIKTVTRLSCGLSSKPYAKIWRTT